MMNGIYRGKVLYNIDPLELGRIKAEVYPMLIGKETALNMDVDTEGIETDVLPWAVPAMGLFDGAGNGYGTFSVPKIGTYIYVFFENGDVYQPVYFAGAPDGIHGLPTERTTNYPDRKVWKSSSGHIIELDDTEDGEILKITHPSSTVISIEPSGKVVINGASEISVIATDKVTIQGSTVEIN